MVVLFFGIVRSATINMEIQISDKWLLSPLDTHPVMRVCAIYACICVCVKLTYICPCGQLIRVDRIEKQGKVDETIVCNFPFLLPVPGGGVAVQEREREKLCPVS